MLNDVETSRLGRLFQLDARQRLVHASRMQQLARADHLARAVSTPDASAQDASAVASSWQDDVLTDTARVVGAGKAAEAEAAKAQEHGDGDREARPRDITGRHWPVDAVRQAGLSLVDTRGLPTAQVRTSESKYELLSTGEVVVQWREDTWVIGGTGARSVRMCIRPDDQAQHVTMHLLPAGLDRIPLGMDTHLADAPLPGRVAHMYQCARLWLDKVHAQLPLAKWFSKRPVLPGAQSTPVVTVFSAPRGHQVPFEVRVQMAQWNVCARVERQTQRVTVTRFSAADSGVRAVTTVPFDVGAHGTSVPYGAWCTDPLAARHTQHALHQAHTVDAVYGQLCRVRDTPKVRHERPAPLLRLEQLWCQRITDADHDSRPKTC